MNNWKFISTWTIIW